MSSGQQLIEADTWLGLISGFSSQCFDTIHTQPHNASLITTHPHIKSEQRLLTLYTILNDLNSIQHRFIIIYSPIYRK